MLPTCFSRFPPSTRWPCITFFSLVVFPLIVLFLSNLVGACGSVGPSPSFPFSWRHYPSFCPRLTSFCNSFPLRLNPQPEFLFGPPWPPQDQPIPMCQCHPCLRSKTAKVGRLPPLFLPPPQCASPTLLYAAMKSFDARSSGLPPYLLRWAYSRIDSGFLLDSR